MPVAEETTRVLAVSHMCSMVLRGEGPGVQGAALADLMSTFLRGHRIPGDREAEIEMREAMLEQWCRTVRQLVELHEAEGMK